MPETSESQDTDLSFLTSAVTQILRATNCPNICRDFIDGLVSVSGGRIDFSISDADLAEGVQTEKKPILRKSRQKWAQRRRNIIKDWNRGLGVDFITFKSGKKGATATEFIPTSYHLPLYSYAIKVIKSAKSDAGGWNQNPNAAIENATNELMNDLGVKLVSVPLATPKTRKTYFEALKRIKSAKTNLEIAAKILQENDTGIYDEGEEVVEELRLLVEELEGRIGYYGEWNMDEPDESESEEGEG